MTSDRTFERIESLFDIQQFAPVKVLIAGCGSGGGNVALQLVMSGIRNFTLLDHDTIGSGERNPACLREAFHRKKESGCSRRGFVGQESSRKDRPDRSRHHDVPRHGKTRRRHRRRRSRN